MKKYIVKRRNLPHGKSLDSSAVKRQFRAVMVEQIEMALFARRTTPTKKLSTGTARLVRQQWGGGWQHHTKLKPFLGKRGGKGNVTRDQGRARSDAEVEIDRQVKKSNFRAQATPPTTPLPTPPPP